MWKTKRWLWGHSIGRLFGSQLGFFAPILGANLKKSHGSWRNFVQVIVESYSHGNVGSQSQMHGLHVTHCDLNVYPFCLFQIKRHNRSRSCPTRFGGATGAAHWQRSPVPIMMLQDIPPQCDGQATACIQLMRTTSAPPLLERSVKPSRRAEKGVWRSAWSIILQTHYQCHITIFFWIL